MTSQYHRVHDDFHSKFPHRIWRLRFRDMMARNQSKNEPARKAD
jgi:hypothetical protein